MFMKKIDFKITKLKQLHYGFNLMKNNIEQLVSKYSFLTYDQYGFSEEGKPLYHLSVGEGKRKIHINASHHANEWITSVVLMNSVEMLCEMIDHKETYLGMDIAGLLKKVTYDFIPMVNPDGVEICINKGMTSQNPIYLHKLNEGSNNFKRWKANSRGVDLNRNYNAGFLDYSMINEKSKPSYAYYQGEYPESEAETRALADLTRLQKYDMVIAYHTQGEVIYWNYKDIVVDNGLKYAKMFSEASGYVLDLPEPMAASGGYKDWFINVFRKPGYTIECGHGENPISIRQVPKIVERTFPIILLASKDLRKEE